jgi:hypothetical protein
MAREYNRDDFFTDDTVMFARVLAVMSAHVGANDLLDDDQFAVLSGRLGLDQADLAALFDRAVTSTQNHDERCDAENAAYRSDPYNVYGTCEHEALLMAEERGEF